MLLSAVYAVCMLSCVFPHIIRVPCVLGWWGNGRLWYSVVLPWLPLRTGYAQQHRLCHSVMPVVKVLACDGGAPYYNASIWGKWFWCHRERYGRKLLGLDIRVLACLFAGEAGNCKLKRCWCTAGQKMVINAYAVRPSLHRKSIREGG